MITSPVNSFQCVNGYENKISIVLSWSTAPPAGILAHVHAGLWTLMFPKFITLILQSRTTASVCNLSKIMIYYIWCDNTKSININANYSQKSQIVWQSTDIFGCETVYKHISVIKVILSHVSRIREGWKCYIIIDI